jgi:hypothetical protein
MALLLPSVNGRERIDDDLSGDALHRAYARGVPTKVRAL